MYFHYESEHDLAFGLRNQDEFLCARPIPPREARQWLSTVPALQRSAREEMATHGSR